MILNRSIKRTLFFISALFILADVYSQTIETRIHKLNAVVYTPSGYSTAKKYPVVIFLPGLEEAGTSIEKLYAHGPAKFLQAGWKPGGFIVACVQPTNGWAAPVTVDNIVKDVIAKYSVDLSRVYGTGLSAGASSWMQYVLTKQTYADKIAGLVVFSQAPITGDIKGNTAFLKNIKLWGICGVSDPGKYSQQKEFTAKVGGRFTSYSGGHSGWDTYYDPAWKEDGESLYDWMLRQRKGNVVLVPPVKSKPVAARKDHIIRIKSVPLTGERSDSNRSIVAYKETRRSGPACTSLNPNQQDTQEDSMPIGTGKVIVIPVKYGGIYIKDVMVTLNPQPGDTLKLPDVPIANVYLGNIRGTDKRRIIVECGNVKITGGKSYGLIINNSSFFTVRNIYVDNTNLSGVGGGFSECSHDFTIDGAIFNGAGLMVKTSPSLSNPAWQHPACSMANITIKNVKVTNCKGEAFYIGHTMTTQAAGTIPAPLVNLVLENLESDGSGWDGIQIANAQNVVAKNLVARNFGLVNMNYQQAGILIGGYVTGTFENLTAENGTGSGLNVFGRGDMKIKNLVIKNVGNGYLSTSKGYGAYISDYGDKIGLGLPALKLTIDGTTIDGAKGNPIFITNKNKTQLPGRLKNVVYKNCIGKIIDNSHSVIQGGTEGK